tara:strand:+ start:4025 stop:4693 length:669 start_codon:yes stop_codon:yes gene_type:complete
MATWRKVATYGASGDALEANITGIAYGGLDHVLTASEGGTGSNTSGWAAMGSPMYNGNTWTSIAGPGGSDKLLISNDEGQWEWKDINDFHNHDSEYAKLSGDTTFSGNLTVLGAVDAGTMTVIELSSITQADGGHIVLNASGGSADGDGMGMFVDINNDLATDTGDPAVLWDASSARWQIGKVGQMYDLGMVASGTTAAAGGAADYAGMFGTDVDGNVFVSV